MLDFLALAQQCAPSVHTDTMQRIVQVESSYNPYAIGVVGGHLERQPRTKGEALATAQWLEANGYNYSVGLAQVNKHNFPKYGLSLEQALEPCPNLRAGSEILTECFVRARKARSDEQGALKDAFSCYYSGNFITGYKQGYVLKIVSANTANAKVPKLTPTPKAGGTLKNGAVLPISTNGGAFARTVESTANTAPTPSQNTSKSALLF